MYKKTFIFCFVLILLFFSNLYSQYTNKILSFAPPWISSGNIYQESFLSNPYTIGYAYKRVDYLTSTRLFRFRVGNPSAYTMIGDTVPYLFGNGDFANPTGVWKFYVQDQYASPYMIYEVDTATGVLTAVGAPFNWKTGHRPRDMEWDHTTNTMYIISQNNTQTEIQLNSLYWPTKELTWIGPSVTLPSGIMAGGFNANGTYFGIDVNTDALWKVNKFTGVWTQIGPLGHYANGFQDAGFDRSNFSRMLWSGWGDTTVGLYEVDTATGHSIFIGSFFGNSDVVVATGFAPYSGPQIVHTPLQNTSNLAGPYVVNATVTTTGSTISSTKLYWSRNSSSITDSVSMTNTSGNNWTANIPGNSQVATYRYYIGTRDLLNRVATAPFNAPSNLYIFSALFSDTTKPVINHTPLGDINILQWTRTVSASVSDNDGIDSVWVRWKVNNTDTKQFKLILSSGSNYLANFNSTYSDIRVGDIIYYRIIAQDNSINHNKDSTGLFSFNITSTDYLCIGNGSTSLAYSTPFNTSWKGFKSQMLYTAQEITENGGVQGYIKNIAFYALNADTLTMNHFNIKMQSTLLSVLNTGFINSGWSTVYSGSFKVQSIGWQYIELQTPYEWDGTSNVLIEICFGNNSSTDASQVQGTTISGMYYYGYRDDTLACSVNPSTASGGSSRPNVCFFIDPLVGMNTNNKNIPSSYNLYQNYPNPFNPITKIKFDIPKQGFVSLKIFDILGREVKILVSEIKTVGSYTIDFDASDLPSGIYLGRLESNGYVITKRMVMVK
jgi:hypothetical protein